MTNPSQQQGDVSRLAKAWTALILLALTSACGTSFERPPPLLDWPSKQDIVTRSEDGISVTAAIPTPEQSRSIFGVDLGQKGVLPIWLEIDNGSDRAFSFLPTGLDPEYFSPIEVAALYKKGLNDEGYAALTNHIERAGFDYRTAILPGDRIAGFVYTRRIDPTVIAEIDLIGQNWGRRISLYLAEPGTRTVAERIATLEGLYDETQIIEIENEAALRKALEQLPCCMSEMDDSGEGLPLNLVLIGELTDFVPAFGRRNYRFRSLDPAYVYGRLPDISGLKTSQWIAPQPHQVRVWLTPLRYRGKPIWLAQVKLPRGGRFALSEGASRGVEPDLDEARNGLLQDLIYSQSLAKIGFLKAVAPSSAERPRMTPQGQAYYSDGLRAVLEFSEEAVVALNEIEFFDWERLSDYRGPADREVN